MADRPVVDPPPTDASALVADVLAEEARRVEAQADRQEVVLPDDLLPGVGQEPMSIRTALGIGGASTLTVLGLGRAIEALDLAAVSVLAPDIQRSLGASDAVMAAIGGAFGALFLLGSIPVSSLADRRSRTAIAAIATASWSLVVLGVAAAQTAFWFFIGRMGAGLAQSHALPVNGPLLMDTYPIPARSRIFAAYNSMEAAGRVVAPLAVGAIASSIAGPDSWRWAFVAAAALGVPLAFALARLREPRRGRNEMQAVLGHELETTDEELPVSLSMAFERLRKIRTFHYFLLGMASLGFALFSIPLFLNLFLEDELGLSAWERGLFGSITALPGIAALAVAGTRTDRLFRKSPPQAVIFVGGMIALFGIFIVIGISMPNVVLVGIFWSAATAVSMAAFSALVSVVSSVIPYRIRSRGTALVGVYIFLFGGFFGSVLTGLFSDIFGRRGAVTLVALPATLIGGSLIAYGARFIRQDISRCTEELLEEQDEARRLAEGGDQPAVQVRNLDFAYGSVQVLFDVGLDVARGETLALLGTNGAGKSTLLRVISGLAVPSRGVVRLHGRTITYTDPELRSRIGIVQLMGGNAVFDDLAVDDNLRMAGYRYDRSELNQRLEATYARFPILAERRDSHASQLSGGQQQILALAMALIHDPEVLIIDELSLGLAPIVVQEVLEIIRELQREGLTMIIVEQSLNVALAVADRALFMEKGQVRFDGPARELAERGDLVRAVFLGDD